MTSVSAPRAPRIAVVDDDPVARHLMRLALNAEGFETIEFSRGGDAVEACLDDLGAVCLDLGLEDMPGLHVLRHVRARDAELPVIVVTAERSLETAIEAMRSGAYDYLVKPIDRERLVQAARRAVEKRELSDRVKRLKRELDVHRGLGAILGESAPMRELQRQIERVLASDVAVMVFGESGTGKELVARAIHQNGARHAGPFIAINCAAVPSALQESELFGHERGAFTGAMATHRGRFEQADKGTLFLDELGEMSAATQAALLRTLQERKIMRVGGSTEIPVDARIVGATHRDLEAEVRAGRFREDLYFRLVVYPIHLPPLRDRAVDIPLLVEHFLKLHSTESGIVAPRVSAEVLDALMRHRWPGNVRELSNVIHRALLSCDSEELKLQDLPIAISSQALPELPPRPEVASSHDLEQGLPTLRELEERAIERAIKSAGGSITKAAKLLGIGRATLYRRLAEDGRLGQLRASA